ncbi:MAG TPA: thioredoxin family protein [Anaerolineae bacterium]|nr:thioredoxin family protein [Anaerolineae bacterium]
MVATSSTMLALGTSAPDFQLPDATSGRLVARDDFADRGALLVMFICDHCPYVRHVADEIARVGREYQERGVAVVAISSNDVEQQPGDAPEGMAKFASERGFSFPYLYDESQSVARAYRAACTPDFFRVDGERRLVYRGQLDGARPSNDVPIDGRELRAALDAVLTGAPIPEPQLPSMGCNIKWKPGNEPDYFPMA